MVFLSKKVGQGLLLAASLLAVLGSGHKALADADFNQGVQLYNQRNFSTAAAYLERAVKNSPWDANAYYYLALSYHQMGDYKKAKDRYRQIIASFPNSPAAEQASAALKQLDPDLYRRLTSKGQVISGGGTGETSADPSLPNQARVYFSRTGNELLVDGELNNHNIKMFFDTGAEACVFGKNHLRQLGITPPSGDPTGFASGVGSSGAVGTWNMNATLKLGSIIRRNFPIMVQESLPTEPLLGQTFYKDYTYVIDNGANSIAFTKKGYQTASKSSGDDRYAVPFVREGNEMVVNVGVNGKQIPMIFDTGAEGITFSRSQLKQVGVSIPEDAASETHTGIGGATQAYTFNVDRMKMGPVDKSNIKVGVVEAANMPHPLLGQTFYNDWQYTIDNDHKVIRFLRR